MRRILTGIVLLGWIAFLAGVVAHGTGAGEYGLLFELQRALVESPLISLSDKAARGILTGIVVLALAVALWTLMFTVATDETERRDRIVSLGAAFSTVLAVCAFLTFVATLAGAPEAVGMLFSIQMATLLTMLAAGGVELAWRGLAETSAGEGAQEADAGRGMARALATYSAGLAAFGPPANDREPRR